MPLPSLLFVAPTLPAAGGNGLAMRAGVFLDALAQDFAVTLVVVPVAGGDVDPASPFVAGRAQRALVVPLAGTLDPLWELSARVTDPAARARALAAYPRPALCRHATTPCVAAIAAAVGGERYAAIHVMRSYLVPYAAALLPPVGTAAPRASLDLDDDEPAAHRRLAALHRAAGRADDERIALAEARKFELLEAAAGGRYARIVACTAAHAAAVAAAHPATEAVVVPNTVELPAPPPRAARATRRLLFVGNLSYAPNVDGIVAFADGILPRLRRKLGADVVLRIAGSAPVPAVVALAARPGVELVANPPSLGEHYAWTDLAVVPLAAGGGTRIKLLEAFAHGVPVVATPIGAEGIAATHDEQLLLAEGAEAFAGACAALLRDPARAAAIAGRARDLVASAYSHAVGRAAVRAALRLPAAG
jgi:glycosyltransferase involved in cell wall biosynthesis